MTVEVHLPLRTSNPNNGAHGHWSIQAKKRAGERMTTSLVLRSVRPPVLPCVVTLVRISPRRMDSDGVRAATKSIRDEVAIWLGLPRNKKGHAEDNDPRVAWVYQQGHGKGHEVIVIADSVTQEAVDELRSREEYRP